MKITAARDGKQYRCVVTDAYGNTVTSEPATLYVASGPEITAQPEDFTGPIGTTATFHVTAEGEDLTYMWQGLTDGKWSNTSFATSKTDTLSMKITAARYGRHYRCVLTDAYGNQVISQPATLIVSH